MMISNRLCATAAAFFFCILVIFPSLAANNEKVAAEVKALFATGDLPDAAQSLKSEIGRIQQFYASRHFKPVWTRDNGPKSKGKALYEEITRASVHGLSPSFYNVKAIGERITATTPKELALLDLLLTDALIDYAHDLRNGRIGPDKLPAHNQVVPVPLEPDELIAGAADAGNLRTFASDLLQVDERYFRLIAKLAEFQRMESAGMWPVVDVSSLKFPVAADGAEADKFRLMLALTGDLPPEMMQNKSASTLRRAVARYQERHGMEATGLLDEQSVRSISAPVSTRLRTIYVNLERRRWQNHDPGSDHLYINLTDHNARLVRGGETEAFLNIIQKPEHENIPAFYGKITGLKPMDDPGATLELIIKPASQNLGADTLPPIHLKVLSPHARSSLLGSDTQIGLTGRAGEVIALEKPLNLFVTYLTSWANRDGTLHFREDIYDRDPAIAEILALP